MHECYAMQILENTKKKKKKKKNKKTKKAKQKPNNKEQWSQRKK